MDEFPAVVLRDFINHRDSVFTKLFYQAFNILNPVIDYEWLFRWIKIFCTGRKRTPLQVIDFIRPVCISELKRGAVFIYGQPQVFTVPFTNLNGIIRFKENAADSCYLGFQVFLIHVY